MNSHGDTRLPFDADFQKALFRHLTEDGSFAHIVVPHIEPQYFESEVLGWCFAYSKHHYETYGAFPSIHVLKNQARQLDPKFQPMYQATLEQIEQAPMRDVAYMKDALLDFIKRNIFVRTYGETKVLYNSGKVTEAYDLMMERMDKLYRTAWEPVDEEWFFEELPARQNDRMNYDASKASIGTGIPQLDHVMAGGLSLGELGIWIAYAKCGKSTLLVNMGVAATKQFRRVAHFVFEGDRRRVADRYDANFMQEEYHLVKRAELANAQSYERAFAQYQMMKGCLVIRGFTERWDYSVLDIHDDLKRWKREQGWDADMLVVDYGDLIKGREKDYPNEREKQKAAFRDLKSLANRGYALWTASQAQRPEKGAEDNPHLVRSRQIADCYEKVRVADFLGSHNLTREERLVRRSRMLAELYRENEAEQEIPLICDLPRMTIKQADGAWTPQLGYAGGVGQQPPAQTGVRL